MSGRSKRIEATPWRMPTGSSQRAWIVSQDESVSPEAVALWRSSPGSRGDDGASGAEREASGRNVSPVLDTLTEGYATARRKRWIAAESTLRLMRLVMADTVAFTFSDKMGLSLLMAVMGSRWSAPPSVEVLGATDLTSAGLRVARGF